MTFDDSDNEPKKPKPATLQDAAKQAGRRFLRRNVPAETSKTEAGTQPPYTGDESTQDTKHYLFSKMLQGYNRKSSPVGRELLKIYFENLVENATLMLVSPEHKEIDAVSEAGTYVIGKKTLKHPTSDVFRKQRPPERDDVFASAGLGRREFLDRDERLEHGHHAVLVLQRRHGDSLGAFAQFERQSAFRRDRKAQTAND